MRISDIDKDIIARCGLHADESLAQLAKRSGHKIHTVRHSLDRLKERGILKRVWMIDIFRLGWTRYQLHFSSAIRNHKVKDKLISFLVNSSKVSFIAELGGDYDYEVLFLGKNSSDVTNLLEECSKQFGEIIASKALIIHEAVSFFPRKYLAKKTFPKEELALRYKDSKPYQISKVDHLILEQLTKNPEITKKALSELTDKSIGTVDLHIKKLHTNGILRCCMFSVNASSFGGKYYVLLIYAKGFDSSFSNELHAFSIKHPHCTNFRRCFGSWDFELGIEALDYQDIIELKEELYEKFGPQIMSIQVFSRFAVHKYISYPFELKDLGDIA